MTPSTVLRSGFSDSRFPARRWFGCSVPVLFLYSAFFLALAAVAFLRPMPTFDRYMYAGTIASFRYSDPVEIHRIARAEFKAQPSPFPFASVADQPYFTDVYLNPDHYYQQLPFYRVKPGYAAIGYLLWRTGMPILTGLRLVSALSFAAVAFILLVWTRNVLLSVILLLTPPVLELGRFVTPDALSTAIVLLALFLLARQKYPAAVCLLIGSLLVRPDNLVLLAVLLFWMLWKGNISLPVGIALGILAIVETAAINHFGGYYGWRVLMQHSFIQPEIDPAVHPVCINFKGYIHAILGLRVIPYTYMTFFILMGAVAWKRLPAKSVLRTLLLLASVATLSRFAIFPNVEDRYFAWSYLLAGTALIRTTHFRRSPNKEETALEA